MKKIIIFTALISMKAFSMQSYPDIHCHASYFDSQKIIQEKNWSQSLHMGWTTTTLESQEGTIFYQGADKTDRMFSVITRFMKTLWWFRPDAEAYSQEVLYAAGEPNHQTWVQLYSKYINLRSSSGLVQSHLDATTFDNQRIILDCSSQLQSFTPQDF